MNFGNISLIMGIALASFLIFLGLAIVWLITQEIIDLRKLLSEANGDASMSRLQLLIFTFTVAFSFFVIVAGSNPPKFPDVPNGVLALLGISAGSYVVSKGIQMSGSPDDQAPEVKVTPAVATYIKGQAAKPTTFQAAVAGADGETVKWSLSPAGDQFGQISEAGIYTPPPDANFPAQETHVQVIASTTEEPKGEARATVTLHPGAEA